MRIVVALLLAQLGSPSLLRGIECNVPVEKRETLLHHLAWTDVWWGVRYLSQPAIHFFMASAEHRIIFYEAGFKMVFTQYVDDEYSGLQGQSCKGTPRECLEEQLTRRIRAPNAAETLRGAHIPTVRHPLRGDDIFECVVPIDLVEQWRPSPDGPEKRALFDKIGAEVRKQAAFAGKMLVAFCNDFNTHDPGVYAVADVVGFRGEKRRLVISMNLTSSNGGRVSTWRLGDEADFSQIVANIFRRDPLRIDQQ